MKKYLVRWLPAPDEPINEGDTFLRWNGETNIITDDVLVLKNEGDIEANHKLDVKARLYLVERWNDSWTEPLTSICTLVRTNLTYGTIVDDSELHVWIGSARGSSMGLMTHKMKVFKIIVAIPENYKHIKAGDMFDDTDFKWAN